MITRPALKYYGGKWDLAKWIISHFVPHDHYIEPCFGAGSVLLQKEPSKLETVNDRNGRLVNFFKVLRDNGKELVEKIELTPWAKDEYKLSQIQSDDSLEDARRFYFMCWMSINGGPEPTGMSISNMYHGDSKNPSNRAYKHKLREVTERLKYVQILNEDARTMLDRYQKYDDFLIYFDPPYLKELRAHKSGYDKFEVDNQFHVDMAEKLLRLKGHVIVSGYQNQLYKELYEDNGYVRVDKEARTNGGQSRTESLWLSPSVHTKLAMGKQVSIL